MAPPPDISGNFHSDDIDPASLEKLGKKIREKIKASGSAGKGKGPGGLTRRELLDLLRELAEEDSVEGRWLKQWLKEQDTGTQPTEPEKPSEKKAKHDDLIEKPGQHRVLEPEELALGKQAHRENGLRKREKDEVEIPGAGRADRVDEDGRNIREIKPAHREKEGVEQLRRYKGADGYGKYSIELTLWWVDEDGNFIYQDYVVVLTPDGYRLKPNGKKYRRSEEKEKAEGEERKRKVKKDKEETEKRVKEEKEEKEEEDKEEKEDHEKEKDDQREKEK
jgi:hypothetical protein